MYRQILDKFTGQVDPTMVQRISDTAFIPFDPANMDYQAYLKWLSEGNEPLPVDEVKL